MRDVHERYLAGLKEPVRQGLLLFEGHQHDVVDRAGGELIDLLRAVPTIVAGEYAQLTEAWNAAEVARWCP